MTPPNDYAHDLSIGTRLDLIEHDLRQIQALKRWLLAVIVTIVLEFIAFVGYVGPLFGEAMAKIDGLAYIHERIDRVESRIQRNEQFIFNKMNGKGPSP